MSPAPEPITPPPSSATPHYPALPPPPSPAYEVHIEQIEGVEATALGNQRPIDVYLPPGYGASTQRYKVLYCNDGQELPTWDMQGVLEQLYQTGAIAPIIVVGVHTTPARIQEYGVAGVSDYLGRGAKAARYNAFFIDELMPLIDGRYRTLRGPANTALMGASLGGLAAFDLAWRHANLFGNVGVFSGSFWWRTDNRDVAAQQRSRIMHQVVRDTTQPPTLRVWLQAGLYDEGADRDGNGVIDAIQDTTELMDELVAKGFKAGEDVRYVEVEGGHSPATWSHVLPQFLQWAFASDM